MPAGGILRIATSNITLSAQDAANLPEDAMPGRYVRLMIADNGPGMSEDVRANALEPYFTTKGPGSGTGLALTGVAHFARQAGGFTSIESAAGQGCAVSIYLPRAPERDAECDPPHSRRPNDCRPLVLVVDDDEEVRAVTCKKLELLGYAVIETKTGVEAVELLKSREDVRLVLSDVTMPGGMSGFYVARWLAANKPGVKVILCSGYAVDYRRDVAPDVVVLSKPHTRGQLTRALNDALGHGETTQLQNR